MRFRWADPINEAYFLFNSKIHWNPVFVNNYDNVGRYLTAFFITRSGAFRSIDGRRYHFMWYYLVFPSRTLLNPKIIHLCQGHPRKVMNRGNSKRRWRFNKLFYLWLFVKVQCDARLHARSAIISQEFIIIVIVTSRCYWVYVNTKCLMLRSILKCDRGSNKVWRKTILLAHKMWRPLGRCWYKKMMMI